MSAATPLTCSHDGSGFPRSCGGDASGAECSTEVAAVAPGSTGSRDGWCRAFGVKFCIIAGFIAGILLSQRLWLTDRTYPLIPVFEELVLPAPFDRWLLFAMLASLAAAAVLPRARAALLLSTVLVALACAGDQSRWQPWVYQYVFILLALTAYPWRRSSVDARPDGSAAAALNACRLIVAATYSWSGLQKCNASFIERVGPWLLEPLAAALGAPDGVMRAAAYAMPATEVLVALGLLFRPTRLAAAVVAVVMHGVILWSIGPWGHGWNTVVWPWNVTMAACVLLLFVRTPHVTPRAIVVPSGPTVTRGVHAPAMLLFGLMPLVSFFDRWDPYLSASLYSGNTLRGELRFDSPVYQALPPRVRALCEPIGSGEYELSTFDWSIDELNVPAYPARRVYHRIAESVYDDARRAAAVDGFIVTLTLVVHERPPITGTSRRTTEYVFGGQDSPR